MAGTYSEENPPFYGSTGLTPTQYEVRIAYQALSKSITIAHLSFRMSRGVVRDSEKDWGHKLGGCGECTSRNCTYNDFVVSPT